MQWAALVHLPLATVNHDFNTNSQFSESWQKEKQGTKSHNQRLTTASSTNTLHVIQQGTKPSRFSHFWNLTAFIIGNGFASTRTPVLTDLLALLAQRGCSDPCFGPLSALSKCCAAFSTRESSWPTCHVTTRGYYRCPGLKIPKVTRPGWLWTAREASGHCLWMGSCERAALLSISSGDWFALTCCSNPSNFAR